MPQLIPYYFINETIYALVILVLMVYISSLYILPGYLALFSSRLRFVK